MDERRTIETAIVILCYNGKSLMDKLLPLVLQRTALNEQTKLFVVDNASTDDSVVWLTTSYPEISLIQLDKNYGFAGGYNKGIEQIGANYYVLLSSDVEVSSNWLQPLINPMRTDQSVGACQPKVRSYYQREAFEYAGASGGFIDSWGIPFCRGRIFNHSELDNGQYDSAREVFWASGCCFAVRAEAWQKTKGLDTDFFAHMEEIDLCWRIQKLGYKIMAFPQSIVFHMGGQTLSYDNPYKLYLNYRNNYAMLVKNASRQFLWTKLPFRMIIDWCSAFYFLFRKGPSSFIAILKGQIHFLIRLKHWAQKRKEIQQESQIRVKGIYSKSIVKEFFIAKNFLFSSLSQAKIN